MPASSARISPSCSLTQGWEVFVLDDLSTGAEKNVAHLREHPAFHLVVDSVLKSSVVNELVHRSDVVFHLAAAVGVRLIVEEPVHTLVTNIQGTEEVLDHCHRFGKRVLIASTSEVYGDRREPEALDEESKRMYGPTTARRWAYAESKALDEFLTLAYHQERGLDCVIVRLFNTVGPRQSGQYGMVIPALRSSRTCRRARSRSTATARRRAASATCRTRSARSPGSMDADTAGQIFNVGSTERVSIGELAERVIAITDSSSEIVYVPYDEVYGQGIEDMLHRQPAIEKVTAQIGWQPTRRLDEILADVVASTQAALTV